MNLRTANAQRTSVGYIQTIVGPRRRPKGQMPIKSHVEVGALLKSLLAATYRRKAVYNRVNMIRSELDEWIMREYNRAELPDEQFLELYYRGLSMTFSHSISSDERNKHVIGLERVTRILVTHYA